MQEENKKSLPLIVEMSADFSVYIDPKILKKELIGRLDTTSANIEAVKKYQALLSDVRYAWQKTLKYSQYFSEFYPPDEKIPNFEALNHHIHAYLEDMTILKNKIEVLLGAIKNDVRKSATNKNEIDIFFKAGVEKNIEVFEGILKHRDPHHHKGMRFLDGDLLKAENAHGALEMFSTPEFDAMLNQEYKPTFFEELKKKKEESFEVGKKHWIEMAQRNDTQTTGYIEGLLTAVRPVLYQYLNIKPAKELINIAGTK